MWYEWWTPSHKWRNYHFLSLSIFVLSNDDETIPPPFGGYILSRHLTDSVRKFWKKVKGIIIKILTMLHIINVYAQYTGQRMTKNPKLPSQLEIFAVASITTSFLGWGLCNNSISAILFELYEPFRRVKMVHSNMAWQHGILNLPLACVEFPKVYTKLCHLLSSFYTLAKFLINRSCRNWEKCVRQTDRLTTTILTILGWRKMKSTVQGPQLVVVETKQAGLRPPNLPGCSFI